MPGGRPMQQWEEANAWRSAILRTNKQQNPLAGRRGFVLRGTISHGRKLGRALVLKWMLPISRTRLPPGSPCRRSRAFFVGTSPRSETR